MTNFEKIKHMTADEVAKSLSKSKCRYCAHRALEGYGCLLGRKDLCRADITTWLNEEVENE